MTTVKSSFNVALIYDLVKNKLKNILSDRNLWNSVKQIQHQLIEKHFMVIIK
jgi:hypothetical protein